ncbi:MAG TPA: LacI family DNA-binding transcriptional regulator, partial [Armatimonadota bacterium]|nr:LacI family DNA-binding transcriptional regulator [Armatimonadota bacterium]
SVRSLVIQACAAGHTRAAFLGRVDCPHEGARYQGYVAGIRDANADDSTIIPCPDISRDAGYTAMANYLVHHNELPLDLLIAANDHRALGAIDALHQYGIAIPEQVAVTGFDNIPAAATAGLTTIHLPMRDIGTEGVKWFLHKVVGAPSNSVAQRCFPCPIIWRSTTGEHPAPEENEP